MSIFKTASGQGLSRSPISYNADYTVLGHTFVVTAADVLLLSIQDAGVSNQDLIYVNGGGLFSVWATLAGSPVVDNSGSAASASTGYHWAARRTGNLFELLVGTTPAGMTVVASGTGSIGGRAAATTMEFMGPGNSITNRATGLRAFASALSDVRIRQECATLICTRSPSDAWGDWSAVLPTDLADRSGNGRTLTLVGAPSVGHQPATLANYLWLPASGAAPVTLAFDAGWADTEDADRIWGSWVKGTTAIASKTNDEAVVTNPIDVLVRQYVFGPFARDGTWDGAVIGVIRAAEDSAASNAQAQMIARIVAPDGTVRGTLVAAQTGTSNEFVLTTLTSRYFPKGATTGLAVTSTSFKRGDYLVLEVGSRDVEAAATNRVTTFSFGENAGADLDFSEVDTGTDNPFIMPSFPLGLVFDPPTAGLMQLQAVNRSAFL